MLIVLTKGALESLTKYMNRNKRIRKIEQMEHDVDPLRNPSLFFEHELRESTHKVIARRIKKTHKLDKRTMDMWILENTVQHQRK